jgi:ATP-dependent Clp protease protease subunit
MNLGNEFKDYAIKHMGITSMEFFQWEQIQDRLYGASASLTPYILEERELRVTQMDIFSRMMMDRIIFLGYPISDEVANIITAQLLFLDSTDRTRDIQMYINSPGGSVYAGLGVYDTMQYVTPDVSTICIGVAASMAAVLMCAGTPGKRTALKHSRIMMHQPSAGAGGQASDIEITVSQVKKLKQELYEVVSLHSGQPVEKIAADFDRDFWMTSLEAKEYGLVDEVLLLTTKKKKND